MKSTRSILLFFALCIIVGIGGGMVLGKLFPHTPPTEQNLPIADTLPELLEEPQVPQIIQTLPAEPIRSTTTTETVRTKKKSCPSPTDPDQEDKWLLAVGPDTSAGTDYIPVHLVPLDSYVITSKPMCLNASAAVRLQQMTQALKEAKLSLVVSSAYRPADYQENLRASSESKRDPVKNPYPLVALPGHSEHQLGTAVDLVAKPTYTLDGFASSPEYAWLAEHAWEYGFVQSYPVGSEPVTGYATESWHWRYVGLTHAKNIHDQKITLYEYLQNLAAKTKTLP